MGTPRSASRDRRAKCLRVRKACPNSTAVLPVKVTLSPRRRLWWQRSTVPRVFQAARTRALCLTLLSNALLATLNIAHSFYASWSPPRPSFVPKPFSSAIRAATLGPSAPGTRSRTILSKASKPAPGLITQPFAESSKALRQVRLSTPTARTIPPMAAARIPPGGPCKVRGRHRVPQVRSPEVRVGERVLGDGLVSGASDRAQGNAARLHIFQVFERQGCVAREVLVAGACLG
jgi:hypothetical protein